MVTIKRIRNPVADIFEYYLSFIVINSTQLQMCRVKPARYPDRKYTLEMLTWYHGRTCVQYWVSYSQGLPPQRQPPSTWYAWPVI